jgi:hypothetical protein
MTTNLLPVLAMTWNEEAIIGDFIDWYRTAIPECTIVISRQAQACPISLGRGRAGRT